jgi:hypothetical protein
MLCCALRYGTPGLVGNIRNSKYTKADVPPSASSPGDNEIEVMDC